jgi:uncharacterized membrane protein SirB2
MTYMVLFYLHVATVIFSGSFFLLRGIWMLMESDLLTTKPVKIVPHINDTLLLGAAIGLSVMSRQYPFAEHWLTVKLIALIAYIGLGVFALRGGSKTVRMACFVAALLTFAFMVSVAVTRSPLGIFS